MDKLSFFGYSFFGRKNSVHLQAIIFLDKGVKIPLLYANQS